MAEADQTEDSADDYQDGQMDKEYLALQNSVLLQDEVLVLTCFNSFFLYHCLGVLNSNTG